MRCFRCGTELMGDDRFCGECGAKAVEGFPPVPRVGPGKSRHRARSAFFVFGTVLVGCGVIMLLFSNRTPLIEFRVRYLPFFNTVNNRMLLGESCWKKQRYAAAIRHFDDTIRMNPGHIEASNMRSRCYMAMAEKEVNVRVRRDYYKKALSDLNHLGELLKNVAPPYQWVSIHTRQAVCCEELGVYEDALRHMDEAIRLEPQSLSLPDHRRQIFQKMNKQQAVQQASDRIFRENSQYRPPDWGTPETHHD